MFLMFFLLIFKFLGKLSLISEIYFFFAIPQAACIFFAFQRYKQGADTAFVTSGFEGDGTMPGGAPYTAYPDGPDMNEGYQEPPFSSTQKDTGGQGFQQPAY